MIQGTIFDMDGTLLDSMGVWENLWKDSLRDRGLTDRKGAWDTIRRLSFQGSAEFFIKSYELPETVDQILIEWSDRALAGYRAYAKPKPLVSACLEELSRRGVRMCVATATSKDIAVEMLEKFDLLRYFSFVLTEQEVGASKSSPKLFLTCADRLGVKPADCAVFEDSLHAIKTAHQAGFYVVAIEDAASLEDWEEIKQYAALTGSFQEGQIW